MPWPLLTWSDTVISDLIGTAWAVCSSASSFENVGAQSSPSIQNPLNIQQNLVLSLTEMGKLKHAVKSPINL